MTDLRKAAKEALWAFQYHIEQTWPTDRSTAAIATLRAALAQQDEPDHETRAELAEQQVVQLAEERDHYRNLWQKAQQAEPAQEPAYKVKVTGRWHDAQPLPPAFSLPDGEHLLYTAPPQRKPLTQEEIDRICASLGFALISPVEIARAIERAHGIVTCGDTKEIA